MRVLLALLAVCVSLTLSADAVLVIKGKARKTSFRVEKSGGARVKKFGNTIELTFRPKKEFETLNLTFKVLNADEYSFALGGESGKDSGSVGRKNFSWIDCNLFKANGKEFVGPNSGKSGVKSMTLAQVKPVKGSLTLKKGERLTLEISLRQTPRDESRRRTDEGNLTEEQKAKLQRKAAREKERKTAREKVESEFKALEEKAAKEAEQVRTSSRYAGYRSPASADAKKEKGAGEEGE